MAQSGSLVLTLVQAKTYRFLLSLDRTGKARQFDVRNLTAQLTAQFGDKGMSRYQGLLSKGLLRRPKPKRGHRGPNVTSVVRRPFSIEGQTGQQRASQAAKTKSRPHQARKRGRPAHRRERSASVASRQSNRSELQELAAHHQFFVQHQRVLAEAEERRQSLRQHNYEVVIVDGEPLLRYVGKY
ncbi:MAG: hypothetical protein HYY50_01660 [Candidatus Kerfeldbacteria bacterium]|nr:hypothetical protein [Candidatus Kerfeldbacteria bacterium]